MSKKYLVFLLIFLITFLTLNLKAESSIIEGTYTYPKYLIILVHGIGGNCANWLDKKYEDIKSIDINNVNNYNQYKGFKKYLEKPISEGGLGLKGYVYAYTFSEPCGAVKNNIRELGDRSYYNPAPEMNGLCWLEKAKKDFKNNFIIMHGREPTPDEMPQKYILAVHSLGNFAARGYIYSDQLDIFFNKGFYKNDIDKVVFVDATLIGSTLAYVPFMTTYGICSVASEIFNDFLSGKRTSWYDNASDLIENTFGKYIEDQLLGGDIFGPYQFAADYSGATIYSPQLFKSWFGLKVPGVSWAGLFDLIPIGNTVRAFNRVDSLDPSIEPHYSIVWGSGIPVFEPYGTGVAELAKGYSNWQYKNACDTYNATNADGWQSFLLGLDNYDVTNHVEKSLLNKFFDLNYQKMTIFHPSFYNLPTAQSKFLSLLEARFGMGFYTNDGDGIVDAQSQRGDGIKHLSNAKRYKKIFKSDKLDYYLNNQFINEVAATELAIYTMSCLTGTPWQFFWWMRYIPAISLITHVDAYQYEINDSIEAHDKIKLENGLLAKALLDTPAIFTIKDLQSTIEVTGITTEEIHLFTDSSPEKGYHSIKIRSYAEKRIYTGNINMTFPSTIDENRKYLTTLLVTQVPNRVAGKLNYLVPARMKQFQYSFNFAAWKDIKNVDPETGEFYLDDLPFAEGQNLLAVRGINASDVDSHQLIKIILNTIPMQPSNFYPAQNYYTNNVLQRMGVEFNKSGYTGDKSEEITITSFKLDGVELLDKTIIISTNEAYKTSTGIQYTPKEPLPPGQPNILVSARSNVGVAQAIWSFFVDTEAPTISVEAIAPYSPRAPAFAEASAGEPGKSLVIHYTTSDNFSTFLRSGTARIYDANGNFITEITTFETQASGDNYLEWNGRRSGTATSYVEDGIYTLKIKAFDEAGNYTISETPIEIDSTPPTIYETEVSPNPMTSNSKLFNFNCKANEESIVMLRLINKETKTSMGYAAQAKALSEGETPRANYSWNYGDSSYGAPEDGLYKLEITASDKAGNISDPITIEAIRIDRTPPVISAQHTDPYVLSNSGDPPYKTTLYYQLSENNDKTPNKTGEVSVKVKLYNENSGDLLWVRDDQPNSLSTDNKVAWGASSPSFNKGAYKFQIVAEDKYGNYSQAFAVAVKDGIAPIISYPINDQAVSGTIAIRGVAMDPDWTNPYGFKDYRIYIAKEELQSTIAPELKPETWKSKFIEVPEVNRNGNSVTRNASIRPLQNDSTLAYLYTNGLENGQYTLLLVVDEEDGGTSVASVRTINIQNDPTSTAINYPVVKLGDLPKEIEFKSDGSVSLPINFINSVKPANVHIEILRNRDVQSQVPEGSDSSVAFYKYLPDVPGEIYTGKPDYSSGKDLGYFIWMDESGWHVRWSGNGSSHHFTGSLMAAGEISNFKTVNWGGAATSSSFITWDTNLSGGEGGFDFTTTASQLIFIPKIDEDPNSPSFSASNVFVGMTKSQFQYLPIMLTPSPTNSLAKVEWDGKLDTGGFVNNGKYTIRAVAEGADGNGLSTDEAEISVKTPFELKDVEAQNLEFDPVGAPDRVSIFYNLSKDSLISAKVYKTSGELVSTVTSEALVYGNLNSNKKLSLSWRGNYPDASGTQTVSFGNYYIELKASALDGSGDKTEKISGITIRGPTGKSLAVLDDIGSLEEFNGRQERIAIGASPYYFTALGSGKYYPPKEFSYTLNTKGQQWIKSYPYVPYALLAHRYFKKVKTTIDGNIGANIKRIWWDKGGNALHDTKYRTKHVADKPRIFTEEDFYEPFSGIAKADNMIESTGDNCQKSFNDAAFEINVYSLGNGSSGKPFILDAVQAKFEEKTIEFSTEAVSLSGDVKESAQDIIEDYIINGSDYSFYKINSGEYNIQIKCPDEIASKVDIGNAIKESLKTHPEIDEVKKDAEPSTKGIFRINYEKGDPFIKRYNYLLSKIKIPQEEQASLKDLHENQLRSAFKKLLNKKKLSFDSPAIFADVIAVPINCFGNIDKSWTVEYVLPYSVSLSLEESVKYSRLTNRFMPWFGFVNKNHSDVINFSEHCASLFELGFPGERFFNDPTFKIEKGGTFKDVYDSVKNWQASSFEAMAKTIIAATKNKEGSFGGSYEAYLADGYLDIIPITNPEGGKIVWDKYSIAEIDDPDMGHALRVGDAYTGFEPDHEQNRFAFLPPNMGHPLRAGDAHAGFKPDYEQNGFAFLPSDFGATTNLSNEADAALISLDYPALQYDIDNELNIQAVKEKYLRDHPQTYSAPTYGGTFHELDLSSIRRNLISSDFSGTIRYDKNLNDYSFEDITSIPKLTERLRAEAPNVFKEEFYITNISPQDISATLNSGTVKIGVSGGASYAWSTADDQNLTLNNGYIISGFQTFNKEGFNPSGKEKKLIASENYKTNLDMISENSKKYAFLDHHPLDPTIHPSDNPNIVIDSWKLTIKDLAGKINSDLVTAEVGSKYDIYLDESDHYNNDGFKVKLKLNSTEKSYVEIFGQAGDAYDLMYFDGSLWKTFWHSDEGKIGRLGFFNVSRLNGKYTVLLKVFDSDGNYSAASKDVLIGTPIRNEAKGRATSPYKRAELNFPAGAFGSKDELVTVTPVKADEISISNRPIINAIGPIVEIKPSPVAFKFDEKGDLRPTLTFRYTEDDLKELYPSIDTSNPEKIKGLGLNIHQITSSGDLQVIDKSDQSFNFEGGSTTGGKVYAFTAALDHFSDYALLQGEFNLKAPTVATDKYIVNYNKIDIYGTAEAGATLNVFVTKTSTLSASAIPQFTGNSSLSGSFKFEGVKLISEGKNYVFVTCKKDKQIETSGYIIVTYDTTPPKVDGGANIEVFSPNSDGKYDEVKYVIKSNEGGELHLIINDPKGKSIINENIPAKENEEAQVIWKGNNLEVISGNRDVQSQVSYTLIDGDYTYNIFAIDEAGNISDNLIGKTTIDTAPPKIISLTADPNPFTPNGDGIKDRSTFSYELSEPAFVKTIILKADNSIFAEHGQLTEFKGSWTWDGKGNYNETASGQYSYYVTAEDLVGNISSSEVKTIYSDVAPFLITSAYAQPSTFSPANPKNNHTDINFELSRDGLKISLDILDGGGKIVKSLIKAETRAQGKHSVSWDGSFDGGWGGPKSGSKVYNGNYSFRIEAIDEKGGEPTTLTGTIVVDGAPPNIVCQPVVVNTGAKTATLNYSISEYSDIIIQVLSDSTSSVIKTIIPGDFFNAGDHSASWSFSELNEEELINKFKFKIKATDNALNTSEKITEPFSPAKASNTFTISDISASPSPFSPNSDGFKDFTNIKYSISGGEPEYSVDVNILNSSGGTVKTLVDSEPQGEGTYSLNWFGFNDKGEKLPDSVYTYKISAKDKAGNDVSASGDILLAGQTSATLSVNPASFSPNGDGASDTTIFNFNISYYFELTGEAKTALRVYDNSGSKVFEYIHSYSMGSYTYSWNGKDSGGASLPDGAYTAKLIIQDPVGTIVESNSINIVIDTSSPLPPSLFGVKSPTNKTLVSVSGEAEPLSTIQLYVNGTNSISAEADSGGNFDSGPAIALKEGSNTIYTKAVDAAGNISNSSNIVEVVCDLSKPAVNSITLSDPSSTKAGKVEFTLNFSKAMNTSIAPFLTFGLASPYSTHLISEESSWTSDQIWKSSFTIDGSTGDGLSTFSISDAADSAGNTMDPDTSFNFIIDTLAPDKPTISQPKSLTNIQIITISGNAEPNSKIVLYQGTTSKETTANGSGLWTLNTALSLGQNTFEASATDPADNTSGLSDKIYVVYDPVPPAFSDLSSSPMLLKGGETAAIKFAASETLSDNPLVLVLTGEATLVHNTGLDYEYSYLVKNDDPTGLVSLTLIGTDEAGNTGYYSANNAFDCFYIDNSAPVTTISPTPEAIADPNTFTPNLDGQNDTTTLMYELSEDSYVTIKIYLFSDSKTYNDSNLVKTLVSSQLELKGNRSHIWDGSAASNLNLCDKDNNGYADAGKYAFIISTTDKAGNTGARMGGSVFAQDMKLNLISADQVQDPPNPNPFSPAVSGNTEIIYKLTASPSGESGISEPIGPLSISSKKRILGSGTYNIGKVTVKVFDNTGNYVNTLIDEAGSPINNKLTDNQSQNQLAYWNGRNSLNQSVNEGIYTITASAEDFTTVKSNNLAYSVVLDKTPPTISNISIDNQYFSPGVSIGEKDTASISYKLADNLSSLTSEMTNEVKVTIDVLKGGNLVKSLTQTTKTVDVSGIIFLQSWDGKNNEGNFVGDANAGGIYSDGSYIFRITAIDLAGNSNQATAEVFVDTTTPTGSIIINSNSKYTKSIATTLILSASDALSGINNMSFSNDGINWSTPEAYKISKAWNLAASDGTKYVYSRYKDIAGNYKDYSDSIILDTTSPTINNVAAGPNPFKDTTIISAEVFDTNIQDVDWKLIIDCGAGYSAKVYSGSCEASTKILCSWNGTDGNSISITQSGIHNFSIYATDEAGNTSLSTGTITIDRAGPTGYISIEAGAACTNKTGVTITLNTSDNFSGVSTMSFSNNGSSWFAEEPYSVSKSWSLTAGEGSKIVYVKLKDGVGNIATLSDTIILDQSPPLISLPPQDLTFNPYTDNEIRVLYNLSDLYSQKANVSASITLSDGITLVKQLFINSRINMGSSEAIWNGQNTQGNYVNEGIYKLFITAIDEAGNQRISSFEVTLADDQRLTNSLNNLFSSTPNLSLENSNLSLKFTNGNGIDSNTFVFKHHEPNGYGGGETYNFFLEKDQTITLTWHANHVDGGYTDFEITDSSGNLVVSVHDAIDYSRTLNLSAGRYGIFIYVGAPDGASNNGTLTINYSAKKHNYLDLCPITDLSGWGFDNSITNQISYEASFTIGNTIHCAWSAVSKGHKIYEYNWPNWDYIWSNLNVYNNSEIIYNKIVNNAWRSDMVWPRNANHYDGIKYLVETRITSSDGNSINPSITGDTSHNVYLAWEDWRNGRGEIFYVASTNEGNSWPNNAPFVQTTGSCKYPSISANNNYIYAAWQDNKNGKNEIYLRRSSDGGNIWTSPVKITSNSTASGEAVKPSIATDSSGNAYISWEDTRTGTSEIYFQKIPYNFAPLISGGGSTMSLKPIVAESGEINISALTSPEVIAPKDGVKLSTLRPLFEWYGLQNIRNYKIICNKIDVPPKTRELTKTFSESEVSLTKPKLSYSIHEFDEGLDRGDWQWKVTADPSGTLEAASDTADFTVEPALEISGITNYPNPFNPNRERTRIRYRLSKEADVTIRIYDITGSLVVELDGTGNAEGASIFDKYNDIEWDGRNGRGDLVMNGIYPFEVKATSVDKTVKGRGKIAVLK